mgnify:FL=1
MNIVRIDREDLIKGNYAEVKKTVETGAIGDCNMDFELGDLLFKLLQFSKRENSNNSKFDNMVGYTMMTSFKMEMCLNFVVRKGNLDIIKEQVVSLFRDNIGRIRAFYDVTAMNIIVLGEEEEYTPVEVIGKYDAIKHLSYLEGVV